MPRVPRLLTFLLLLASPALAGGVRGTEVERVLRQIAAAQEKVDTLEASFRQEKTIGLLAAPEVSTGTFFFSRPNRVLWRYDRPKRLEMLVADGWLTTWYPDLNRAERIEIKRYEERIFRYLGAAAGAIDDLDRYFDFRLVDRKGSPHYTLELTPRSSRVARRVRRLKVWVDRESWLTTALEYEEGDGDMTRYEFSDLRVNGPVQPGRLELSLPATVQVETLTTATSR